VKLDLGTRAILGAASGCPELGHGPNLEPVSVMLRDAQQLTLCGERQRSAQLRGRSTGKPALSMSRTSMLAIAAMRPRSDPSTSTSSPPRPSREAV
jgi:hypothetical protein